MHSLIFRKLSEDETSYFCAFPLESIFCAGDGFAFVELDGPGFAFEFGIFVGEGVEVGVGAIFEITTPLFQTCFFPALTQVNFTFAIVLVEFNFRQLVPEIDAEFADVSGEAKVAPISATTSRNLVRNIWRD